MSNLQTEATEAVKARLQLICDRHDGVLRPSDVVEDAKSPDSPLHSRFTWDVNKAAELYWLDQARDLIKSVQIVFRTTTYSVKSVAYVRSPTALPNEQGYRAVSVIRTESENARAAIVDEFTRIGHQLRKARNLAVVLGAESEVESILARVVGLRQSFESEQATQQ